LKSKGSGSGAQVQGPELKPQYNKKKIKTQTKKQYNHNKKLGGAQQ
jgi:hypothetical protein